MLWIILVAISIGIGIMLAVGTLGFITAFLIVKLEIDEKIKKLLKKILK